MFDITELHDGQCHYPLTDASPHFFCGDPVKQGAYCGKHARLCYAGSGKPWQSLAAMIDATETTVAHVMVRDEDVQPELDNALASANWIDRPGGLMDRS